MHTSDLTRLCHELGITSSYRLGDKPRWDSGQQCYKVTLRRGRQRLTEEFWTNVEPETADVLYSLILDARAGEDTFEDFCGEFGYDTDSRQAEQTWKACHRVSPRVRNFLGEHFEALAQAEH